MGLIYTRIEFFLLQYNLSSNIYKIFKHWKQGRQNNGKIILFSVRLKIDDKIIYVEQNGNFFASSGK